MASVSQAPLSGDPGPRRISDHTAGNEAHRPGNHGTGDCAQCCIPGTFLRARTRRHQHDDCGNDPYCC